MRNRSTPQRPSLDPQPQAYALPSAAMTAAWMWADTTNVTRPIVSYGGGQTDHRDSGRLSSPFRPRSPTLYGTSSSCGVLKPPVLFPKFNL